MSFKDLYKKVLNFSGNTDSTSTAVGSIEMPKTRENRQSETIPESNGKAQPKIGTNVAEKERLVRQFREWLDGFPEIPESVVAGHETEEQTDLYTLFAEFIALKNEIKIESRQFKSGFDDFRKTLELLENSLQSLQKEQEGRTEDEKEIRFLATRALIAEMLEFRDRVEDSQKSLDALKPQMLKRRHRKKKKLLTSIKQGQAMLMNRIDKLLQNHGVLPIEAKGYPFDPHKMRAVEIDRKPKKENGIVLAVLRKGYTLRDEAIRVADVISLTVLPKSWRKISN